MKRTLLTVLLLLAVVMESWAGMDFSMMGDHGKVEKLINGSEVRYNKPKDGWNKKGYIRYTGESTSPMKEGWSIIASQLDEVEQVLNVKLLKEIEKLSRRYPDETITVIDWGCGMGDAISMLAWNAESAKINNVEFIGFSNMYFPSWQYMFGKVNYILDDMSNLTKYLRGKRVGLVYSHFGLYHNKTPKVLEHMQELSAHMVEGGLILWNCCEIKPNTLNDLSSIYFIHEYFTEYDKVDEIKRKAFDLPDKTKIMKLRAKRKVGAGFAVSSTPIEENK